jgi:hypothetical protein
MGRTEVFVRLNIFLLNNGIQGHMQAVHIINHFNERYASYVSNNRTTFF